MNADEPLWRPSPERVAGSHLARFAASVADRAGTSSRPGEASPMPALHGWSIREPAAFWAAVWDFCGLRASQAPTATVDDATRMPGARWFEGARLNFAENLLAERRPGGRRPVAIVGWNENGPHESISWSQLLARVAGFADGLRRAGIGPGDRVAGFLPNIPEAVVAMLASSSLGAVWSSCSPDFGIEGVLDRFGQTGPKALACSRGALWNGAWRGSLDRVRAIAERLPSLTVIVVAEYGSEAGPSDLARIPRAVAWEDFTPASRSTGLPEFVQLPFDHPLYVLYSSGTTGMPKCIVHGQGGTLIQHMKELTLHCDVRPGDAICYYTTCGWMMWNWMATSLAVGATVVLFDGSPFRSTPERMWDVIDAEGLSHFGTSARYLGEADKRGLAPRQTHDLSSLRTILSTGSPLMPGSFDWVYANVKSDVHLASISGGTDLVSCFVLGDPAGPVFRGEIQTAGLGMAVEVWDEIGRPLPPGEKGELVCTRAFPSMPVAFWDDPDGSRYRAAYFESTARPAWRHGDWIERTAHGGFIIHGRSDVTLNPGGVRIGTAEIYRQLHRLEEIVESVAVGRRTNGDETIALFVVLRNGLALDDALRLRIREEIRAHCSPRHVPKTIVAVPDIPRTISGKISEVAVRRALHGLEVENAEALANPEALAHFRDVQEPMG